VPTERRKVGPRAPHRPPKHGARALARHLASGTLDKRTGIARDFYAIQDALAEERGGHVSTGERVLFEIVATELLICRSIFAWVARQPSIIDETPDGPRLLGPLAKGYTSHASSLTRAVQALGLRPERVERLPSLQEYITSRSSSPSAAPPSGAPQGTTATATPSPAVVVPTPSEVP
jgi:hypothetical protein